MEDFTFFIMFITFISGLGILVLWKLYDMTRNSINKNKPSYDEEKFDRLAKAFIEHRKDTDRRLENIEAILTEGENRAQLGESSDTRTIESSNFNGNNKRKTK